MSYITDYFKCCALKHPTRIAIVCEKKQITYKELEQLSDRIANYIRKLFPVQCSQPRVGIFLDHSINMYAAILGSLKAGAVCIPLDLDLPTERFNDIVNDANVSLIVTNSIYRNQITKYGIQTNIMFLLTEQFELLAHELCSDEKYQRHGEDLAYITFTSGTTGKPKGVMVEHQNLISICNAWKGVYNLNEHHVHLQMAGCQLDVFFGNIVRSLCFGGQLVICAEKNLPPADKIYKLLQDEAINFAEFVPTVMRKLIGYLEENNKRLDFMDTIICGSDSWTIGEYKRLRKLTGSNVTIVNSYGTAETTIDSTYFIVDDSIKGYELTNDSLVPVGKPFSNTEIYLLDDEAQPVSVGEIGEIYIGGAGVTRGYLNLPQANSSKFITIKLDGFDEAKRLYKTGDKAKFIGNDMLQFLGRDDQLIKINDQKVKLDGSTLMQNLAFAPLRSNTEKVLELMLKKTLKVGRIKRFDNILDVCNDVSKMSRFLDVVNTTLNKDVSFEDIKQYPTIPYLAKLLDEPLSNSKTEREIVG